MAWLLDTPLAIRLAVVAAASAGLASLINAAIYHWAWERRLVSPWQPTPPGEARGPWADRLPVLGWLRRRREAPRRGAGFWVRPLLLELAFPAAMATLYWWEVEQLGLVAPQVADLLGATPPVDARPLAAALHLQFFAHALLAGLMTIATFIDFDERTIPDEVTLPGTLLGLGLVAASPWVLPPSVAPAAAPPVGAAALVGPAGEPIAWNNLPLHVAPTHLAAPAAWPPWLGGRSPAALAIGLACFWLWALALTDRHWPRAGAFSRKLRLVRRRVVRDLSRGPLGWAAAGGTVLTLTLWGLDGARWAGFLSALVGLAVSGSLVWAVRLIGAAVLRKEAMGFGDVTLMMMVGAFTGWQASPLIFFLAPGAGLVLAVLNVVLHGDRAIPYGPFLCLATAGVLVFWGPMWSWAGLLFGAGWVVPAVLAACFVLLGVLLCLLQGLKWLLGVTDPDDTPPP